MQHLHTIGKGCPDIVVGFRGANILMELKDGDKAASKQKLTDDETEWHDTWRGQVAIVRNIAEALHVLGVKTGTDGERNA